jgi:hypothetical protein
MSNADFVYSTGQVAYERPASAAENALTQAVPHHAVEVGPVNLTWHRPIQELWPDD